MIYIAFMAAWPWLALPLLAGAVYFAHSAVLVVAWVAVSAVWLVLAKVTGGL